MSKKQSRISAFLAVLRKVQSRLSANQTNDYARGYIDALRDVETSLRHGPSAVQRHYWDQIDDQ